MRDRLIELVEEGKRHAFCDICEGRSDCENCENERIADHLLANGVIVPPCKVGDKAWCIFEDDNGDKYISEKYVTHILVRDTGLKIRCGFCIYDADEIGDELFFTREEAEKALERSNENAE